MGVQTRIGEIRPPGPRKLRFARGLEVEVAAMVALVLGLVAVAGIAILLLRSGSGANSFDKIGDKLDAIAREMDSKFTRATADMAERLSETKGELRQTTADRIGQEFLSLRNEVERQLKARR